MRCDIDCYLKKKGRAQFICRKKNSFVWLITHIQHRHYINLTYACHFLPNECQRLQDLPGSVCHKENICFTVMDNEHKCPHCSGTFKTKTGLRSHLVTHINEKMFSCSKCSKHFVKKEAMDSHIRRVHLGIRPHKCVICTSTFSTTSELKSHLGTHDKPKSYGCHLCSAVFVQKGALSRHLSSTTHAGKIDIIFQNLQSWPCCHIMLAVKRFLTFLTA